MKKYSLLKSISFVFLAVIVLSFIIPIGSFSSNVFTTSGTSPIGIYDIFNISTYTIANFLQFGLLFLAIGGFYGVLNATGAYSNLVEKLVKKLKGKELVFIICTSIFFALISSLTGLGYVLFLVVPFYVAILLSLGFSKITSFMATVVSIIVGYIGNISGAETTYSMMNYFKVNANYEMFSKIILFVLVTFILILFVVKNAKKDLKKKQKEEIPLYEKSTTKKGILPLVIIGIFTLILLLVSMYKWDKILGINFFNNIYTHFTSFEINGYPLFTNILGSSIKSFGYWSIYDMIITLVLSSILLSFIYSVKTKEYVKAFYNGVKKMFVVAIIAVIVNIIFMTMYKSSAAQNMYFTFVNYFINLTKSVSLFSVSMISAFGSIFYNDFASMVNVVSGPITSTLTDTTMYPFIGLVMQTIYNLFMLLVPTSVILMAGLAYFNISYKEWLKNAWKFLLALLGIIMVVLIILLIFL